MSEHAVVSIEEPPSFSPIELHEIRRESLSNLESLAVMDPADPFVWLHKQTELDLSKHPISARGKDMLWMVYRMNGHFPADGSAEKLRDQEVCKAALSPRSGGLDVLYLVRYQVHLNAVARLREEGAMDDEFPSPTPREEMTQLEQDKIVAYTQAFRRFVL